MKSRRKIEISSWHRRAGRFLFTGVSLALATSMRADTVGAGQDPNAPIVLVSKRPAPKDHALFVGADVQVEDGRGFFEIAGADGNWVSLLADGKLLHIRRDTVGDVRIERTLKLTDVVARIDKMIVTPTSVGASAPTKPFGPNGSHADLFADLHQQMLMNDLSADATDRQVTAAVNFAVNQGEEAAASYATAVGGLGPAGEMKHGSNVPILPVDKAAINKAQDNYVTVQAEMGSLGHVAPDGDNALNIACELSTPRVMHNTYALVLTELRDAKGGKSSYNVDIEPVGELGPKPRKMTFTQTGLPPGFTFSQVGLHLYAGRLELATNLSEGRVDLTADDAMRYLVLAYVTNHPKESLAAAPLRIAVPADFKQRASTADLDRTLYLKIDPMGRVRGLSAAPDKLVAVDPYIELTVRRFYYEPAIKDGKPVESVVAVRLAGLLH
jgi:hypothetical protein